jgi:hypothetical protein
MTIQVDVSNPHLTEEIELMSEMFLGLIEHAKLQEKNMPKDSWKNCWLPFSHERIRKSPQLMNFFRSNNVWYTQALRDVFREYKSTLSTK